MEQNLVARAVLKMTDFYKGNRHDIAHTVKVLGYARNIGLLCGLDEKTQERLELTAVVHDASIPRCRELYGRADGSLQEKEAAAVIPDFLADLGCEKDLIDRVTFLVAHHHTLTGVDGMDWQILLEADFLVNADEGNASEKAILAMYDQVFKTEAGKAMLENIYLRNRRVSL